MSAVTQFTTLFVVFLTIIAICSANIATGRASLRPSAGKRSRSIGYDLPMLEQRMKFVRGIRNEPEESFSQCSSESLVMLNIRFQQLRQEMNVVLNMLDGCQNEDDSQYYY